VLEGSGEMSEPALAELIELARGYVMSPEEREQQIRSFAYGNVKLHNPAITREDIDCAADEIARKAGGWGRKKEAE